MGVFGAGDPQNLKCGDCNPQKAHMWVMPGFLSVYTLKSVHGFGQAAFPRKKRKEKKSHKEHIWPNFTMPWGRHRLFDREQSLVGPLDFIIPANFNLDRLRTGCVALHESLLSFRFSALHRLSPLTQLGPAGPLVMLPGSFYLHYTEK